MQKPHPFQTATSSASPRGAHSSWMAVDVDKLLADEGYDETRADEFQWWNVVDKLNTQTPPTVIPDTKVMCLLLQFNFVLHLGYILSI